MFCPQCGQQRLSTETSFCSRCGYLLTGTAELLLHDGLIPYVPTSPKASPRTRGVKQGAFVLLSALFIVPLLTVIAMGANMPTPILPLMALFLLVGGGLLRIAYALMFQSGMPSHAENVLAFPNQKASASLPQGQGTPVSDFSRPTHGSWRTTNDLVPPSVTDSTTKLLEREEIR